MKSSTGVFLVLILVAILITGGCVQEKSSNLPPPSIEAIVTSTITSVASPGPSLTSAVNESLGGPIRFVPGRDYHAGDKILMSGTTILSPGNQLLIEVSSLAFTPTNKTQDNSFSGASALVTVEKGPVNSQNTWQYTLDTTGFLPGDYQVLITGVQVTQFRKSASFTLLS